MCYNSAEVLLYEPSLYKSLLNPKDAVSQRLDMLYGCLLASQKLLDGYVAMSPSEYYGFSIVDLAHLGRGLTTLLRLSLLDENGWDKHHVRQTADLIYYFDHVGGIFEQVGSTMDQGQRKKVRDSFPTGCARAMKRVKVWYESKIALEADSRIVTEEIPLESMEFDFTSDHFDYWNDRNLLELMGDGAFLQ
jgi:hypothetical protein